MVRRHTPFVPPQDVNSRPHHLGRESPRAEPEVNVPRPRRRARRRWAAPRDQLASTVSPPSFKNKRPPLVGDGRFISILKRHCFLYRHAAIVTPFGFIANCWPCPGGAAATSTESVATT